MNTYKQNAHDRVWMNEPVFWGVWTAWTIALLLTYLQR